MTLTVEHRLILMAYADDELQDAERSSAEALLSENPDAAEFVAQLAGLGEVVALGFERDSGPAIARFDVADAVMARLNEPSVLVVPKGSTNLAGTVTSITSARRVRPAVGVGIAAALALAASLFLFARHRTEELPMAKTFVPTEVPSSPSSGAVAAAVAVGTGVDVTTLNSASNSVSVFYLPSANELSTSVVVWVDETGEK
jgi:anti-sigma factor RsiW